MKIYVAGKWEERVKIKCLMNELSTLGHTITADWTTHENIPEHLELLCAIHDIYGVKQCELLIAIAEREHSYKGMLCEIGAALALEKDVIIVGHNIDSCIFTKHPLCRKVNSISILLDELED